MLGVAIQGFAWLDAKMFADRFGIDACEEDACEEQHASDRHHGRLIASPIGPQKRHVQFGCSLRGSLLSAPSVLHRFNDFVCKHQIFPTFCS